VVEPDAVDDGDVHAGDVALVGGDHTGESDVLDGARDDVADGFVVAGSQGGDAVQILASDRNGVLAQCFDDDRTARSMPRRTRIGLAPASTERSPSRTIAWARTVAVVVPSPTRPLVFMATSLTNWAPMLANGSRSWNLSGDRHTVVGDGGGTGQFLQDGVAGPSGRGSP